LIVFGFKLELTLAFGKPRVFSNFLRGKKIVNFFFFPFELNLALTLVLFERPRGRVLGDSGEFCRIF
jgi:hypothetical protein